MSFDSFVKDITDNNWKVHGVEYYDDGKLCGSYGDVSAHVFPIYSATKTVLSIAVGIARDMGKIDIDKDVLFYMPEPFVSEMDQAQKDKFKKITLRRLMTMSVGGFPFRPESDEYLRFSLNCPDVDPDEETFNYSNISAYLTGVALTRAVDLDGWDFISKNLIDPLGINDAEYQRCSEGFFYGASGMKLTVNDLSRIGSVLYNNGLYEGRRIVSEEYVKEAASIQIMNREGGYGFFIWKYRDGFSINGKFKQKCCILPSRKKMITYLSDIQDDSHDLINSMEKNILGL